MPYVPAGTIVRDTEAGPLHVTFNSATRANVRTPSNWGTYPELRTRLNGAAAYGIQVFLDYDPGDDTWSPVAQNGCPAVYASRADNRRVTAAAERAAALLAVRTVLDILADDPDVTARAQRASILAERARIMARIAETDELRATLAAQLAAIDDQEA